MKGKLYRAGDYLDFLLDWMEKRHPVLLLIFMGSSIFLNLFTILHEVFIADWFALTTTLLFTILALTLGVLFARRKRGV